MDIQTCQTLKTAGKFRLSFIGCETFVGVLGISLTEAIIVLQNCSLNHPKSALLNRNSRSLPFISIVTRDWKVALNFFRMPFVYRMIRERQPMRRREKHATGKSHDVLEKSMGKRLEEWKRRWTDEKKKLNINYRRSMWLAGYFFSHSTHY